MRALLLAHRYLGIAVGALMVSWCLSGIVMVFVPFPRLSEERRLQGLPPIAWEGCCRFERGPLHDGLGGAFAIEMLAERPVLRARANDGAPLLLDLLTGDSISRVSAREAAVVAQAFASRSRAAALPPADVRAAPRLLGLVESDQWTVGGVSSTERPTFRFALDDRAGTEVYVSSRSGRVVQATTALQRFWSWLGPIPHWLYFARLRAHVALWTAFVVYASLAGCFLTAMGIVIGVRQLRPRPGERWSPYRGFGLWHHVAGVIFGLFTLTWVASGLLSMNPWGLLDSDGAEPERARLAGAPSPTSRVQAGVQAVAAHHGPSRAVSVAFAPLGGRPYFVVTAADGQRRRVDEAGSPAPLEAVEVSRIAVDLVHGAEPGGPERLTEGDDYFFSGRHEPVRLPVLRIASGGGDGTRYYLDPVTGDIEAKIDRNGKRYRWLHGGLHRLDFASALRSGPLGYVLVLSLMAGVLIVCVTGAYVGWRRLVRWRRRVT